MSKPTALGVYIFAGGHTHGVKRAGFKILGHLEDGMFGVKTSEKNFPELVLNQTIYIDPKTWPAEQFKGVDWIYGNPPCAPFSVANASPKREGATQWMRDERTECIRNQFALLKKLRPHVWSWESVQQAWTRGRPLIDELTQQAKKMGYSATYVFLNTAHLGVPQIRRRMFVIFHNVLIPWQYPKEAERRFITVREAWEELEDTTPEFYGDSADKIALAMRTKPGDPLRRQWDDENKNKKKQLNALGGVKGRPGFHLRKISLDEPSCTLIGGASYYHPTEPRHLTVKETQVLCGYPADYEFVTSTVGWKYAEIGRAVMPPVAYWLATNIRKAVEMNIALPTPTIQTMDFEQDGRRKP